MRKTRAAGTQGKIKQACIVAYSKCINVFKPCNKGCSGSQDAVSADTITDTDLFEDFFLLCRIIYRDPPIRHF